MKYLSLKTILIPLLIMGSLAAQSVTGNYELHGIYNIYTYEARDTTASEQDQFATYDVTASWPSSSTAMYTHTLKHFAVGDTITTLHIPLLTPEALALAGYIFTGDPNAPGVAINIDYNDDGTFIINDGSIYPTTEAVNCSTFATLPTVSENGTWTYGGDPIIDATAATMTWGWGITLSNIFANFNAPDLAGGDVEGVDYGPNTPMPDWGRITVEFDPNFANPLGLHLYWEAHDGVGSGLGIDDAGLFNGFVGIPTLDSDTSTVVALQALNPTLNVGNYPIFGGSGMDLDGDGEPDGIVEDANWGYIFDPVGANGIPFDGDEPLQFTGYYFTKNFLTAAGAMTAGFDPANIATMVAYFMGQGLDQVSATVAAADSLADVAAENVALALGANAATAAAIGASVGASVSASLNAYLAGGGTDLNTAIADAAAAAAVTALGGLAQAGIAVNDSDHDCVAPYSGNGRLVYELDNRCIPDNTEQRVETWWVNTALGVVSNEAQIPDKFVVYDNYPNPFNPSTHFSFDLPTEQYTEITVWNLMGQKVATLHSGDLKAGSHKITFSGRNDYGRLLSSGMYFYRVDAGSFHGINKMLLLK